MKKNSSRDHRQQANNPTEMLDLVDEHDVIIGQVERKKANQDPSLIHREVGILIVDSQQRVLFQQRSKYKSTLPLVWSISCAGHIGLGQEADRVAHQELKEELGFDTRLVFLEKVLQKLENETHFMSFYLGFYNGEPINFDSSEVAAVRFFSKAELDQFIADGNAVNHHHDSILKKWWSGEYNKRI